MEHEIHSRLRVVHAIAPAAIAADTSGAAIDTRGFESLEYVLHVGTAMVGGGFTCVFQESTTGAFGGEETTVPAAHVIGGSPVISIGDTNLVLRVGVIGKERYQRIRLIETGTITGGVVGVTALLGDPKEGPVADQNT